LSDMRQAELITWVDPYVLDRPWNTPEELDEKLSHMNCHTVGYVAKETDDFVVLAQGYSLKENGEDVEEWGHCWVLPKICIIDRKRLDTEWKTVNSKGEPYVDENGEPLSFCIQHQTYFSNKHPYHEQCY
jgi:hypothetical protein